MEISRWHQYVFAIYLFHFTNMITVTSWKESTVAGLQTGEVGHQPVCIKTSREMNCKFLKAGIRWHLANFSRLN